MKTYEKYLKEAKVSVQAVIRADEIGDDIRDLLMDAGIPIRGTRIIRCIDDLVEEIEEILGKE